MYSHYNKKSKKEIYLNIIFIITVIIFIVFNISSTIKYFDIDRKTEILNLEPYNYERVLNGFSFLERDQNGKHFDPKVVNTFFHCVHKTNLLN